MGIMEKKVETIMAYWGSYMRIMEKKMETMIVYWCS